MAVHCGVMAFCRRGGEPSVAWASGERLVGVRELAAARPTSGLRLLTVASRRSPADGHEVRGTIGVLLTSFARAAGRSRSGDCPTDTVSVRMLIRASRRCQCAGACAGRLSDLDVPWRAVMASDYGVGDLGLYGRRPRWDDDQPSLRADRARSSTCVDVLASAAVADSGTAHGRARRASGYAATDASSMPTSIQGGGPGVVRWPARAARPVRRCFVLGQPRRRTFGVAVTAASRRASSRGESRARASERDAAPRRGPARRITLSCSNPDR